MAAVSKKDFDKLDNEIKKLKELDSIRNKSLNDSLKYYKAETIYFREQLEVAKGAYDRSWTHLTDIITISIAIIAAITFSGIIKEIIKEIRIWMQSKLKTELKKELKEEFQPTFHYLVNIAYTVNLQSWKLNLAQEYGAAKRISMMKEQLKEYIIFMHGNRHLALKYGFKSTYLLEDILKDLESSFKTHTLDISNFTSDEIDLIKTKINDLEPKNEKEEKIIQDILSLLK